MSTKHRETSALPPFCPSCDAEGSVWKAADRAVKQVLRGETFTVHGQVMECAHCGYHMLTDAQADRVVRLTADAYRLKHGLLSSTEIVSRRVAMAMSQQEFADHLGVGIASLKRWENGHVQDLAGDRLIRRETDHVLSYLSDVYAQDMEPRIDHFVFHCTNGFKTLAMAALPVGAKAKPKTVSEPVCEQYFTLYAFTATA